jgi:hypothetical protein
MPGDADHQTAPAPLAAISCGCIGSLLEHDQALWAILTGPANPHAMWTVTRERRGVHLCDANLDCLS